MGYVMAVNFYFFAQTVLKLKWKTIALRDTKNNEISSDFLNEEQAILGFFI